MSENKQGNMRNTDFILCEISKNEFEIRHYEDNRPNLISYLIMADNNGYYIQDQFGCYVNLSKIADGYWNNSTVKEIELLKI